MENRKTLINRNFETIAWGMFFIWWGITDSDLALIPSLPQGTGWIGIGLILLGLNAARSLNGIPASSFTTILGILALAVGGLKLTRSILGLPPIELSLFPILLVALGMTLLMRELLRGRKMGSES